MTNLVYRIQDNEGRGPWKPGFSKCWVEPRSDHEKLIPWYMEFGLVHLSASHGMHFGCGCTSIDQLKRWFSPTEYHRLVEFGYHAVHMKVGRILARSNIQCVFERAAPLHKDVSPFELYEVVTQ